MNCLSAGHPGWRTTPVRRDPARNDQIAVDERRGGPAVGESEPAKFLHHRVLPEELAVGRERSEYPLRSLEINVPGFWIDRGAGSGVAQIDGVTQKIAVALLPQFGAGFRVETGQDFL